MKRRVLLLEDDVRDAELVTYALQRSTPDVDVRRVDTESAFSEALESFQPDVVLSDRGVPGFSSLSALHLTQAQRPETPFIIVAGTFDASCVELLKSGAADFITKLDLHRLPPAIDVAVERRAPMRKLSRRQREVFRLLASGISMRDIAARLGLSRKTVETHRAQVMARLGVQHVTELVRHAIRLGVVSAE
jgi:DNA-binding NarL/FixJ family response regulator